MSRSAGGSATDCSWRQDNLSMPCTQTLKVLRRDRLPATSYRLQAEAKMRVLSGFAAVLMLAAHVSGQSATVALIGARVIDGTGAAPIANATVLISNGRIERIG